MKAAEEEMKEKFNIISFFKNLDQLRVLKKIILNEPQCYMLKNIDKYLISNSQNSSVNTMKMIKADKIKSKKEKLEEYLKKKNEDGTVNNVEELLFCYMDVNMKEEITKELN